MIRIERCEKPKQLTDEKVKELTERFKENNKSSVWKQTYIQESLMKMTNNKCIFCETQLLERGKYMEVEHFHPKSIYPDEVVLWDNLLPICSDCNKKKGNYDTKKFPILNPTTSNLRDSLAIVNYRLKPKDELGKRTINLLDLNNSEKLMLPRMMISEKVRDKLSEVLDIAREYAFNGGDQIKKNKILMSTIQLLKEAQPTSTYSATVATVLFQEAEYQDLKEALEMSDIWCAEIDELHRQASNISLAENV